MIAGLVMLFVEPTQVREQAKAFLQKPEDHVQGLNLINSTNLDYFQPQHQAEMINLKAQFCAALGDGDAGVCRSLCRIHTSHQYLAATDRLPPALLNAAHGLFSESLTLWPLCWEAWMAWGKFCDGMYEKSKEGQWLEFLATCYLQVSELRQRLHLVQRVAGHRLVNQIPPPASRSSSPVDAWLPFCCGLAGHSAGQY